MSFKDKYISESEKKEKPESKKLVLSDNFFALCEQLEKLTGVINLKW